MQTFHSEIIYKHFQIRKTFILKNDLSNDNDVINDKDNENNICEIFYTNLKQKEVGNMSQSELFVALAHEIKNSKFFDKNSKYLAVLSFTRYNFDVDKNESEMSNDPIKGYCALGAEWLAVYGTPCLFSWAENLNDIERCFTDNTLIDNNLLMNDSAFRNTYWACYSTTLGSLLHEFTHILDIGHNISGIMHRGFDDLYRFFTVQFDKCSCYLNHSKVKANNFFIERITTVSNQLKNKERQLKQTRVNKIAIIKKEFINSDPMIPAKTETVFSLICDQNLNSIESNFKTNKHLFYSKKCDCLLTFYYEESNLNMLFYNKWFNNQNPLFNKPTRTFDEAMIENNTIEIKSFNRLVLFELRTVKYSFTFKHEFLKINDDNNDVNDDLKNNNLVIYFKSAKSALNKLVTKLQCTDRLANERFDAFEIVAVDELGNIFKKIAKF